MTGPRGRIVVVLMILVLPGCFSPSSPDPQPAPAPAPPPPGTATALIEVTNSERAKAGLTALRMNAGLMEAAQIQAEQVAAAGRLEHTLPEARFPQLEDRLAAVGYDWQLAGENLAFGQRSAAAAVETWMQSPTHRSNIMSGSFTELGAGFVVDPTGRPYYVQVFGRPR
jgi:uncharacterized protein YkwD